MMLLLLLLLLSVNHEQTQAFSPIIAQQPLLLIQAERSKTTRTRRSSFVVISSTPNNACARDAVVALYLSSTKRRNNEAASSNTKGDSRSNNSNSNSNSNNRDENEEEYQEDQAGKGGGGIRLNKAFTATHSRRQADCLIQEGRVRVNGELPSSMGVRLFPGDVVTLDYDTVVYWEKLHHPATRSSRKMETMLVEKSSSSKNYNRHDDDDDDDDDTLQLLQQQHEHVYIKYWKPRGVECTTDRRVRNNIIDALGAIPGVAGEGEEHTQRQRRRIWPMGRLDKDSTGLILLTSDGTTTQRVLKSSSSSSSSSNDGGDSDKSRQHDGRRVHWKTYWVETDQRATDQDLQKLAQGVRILAPTSRDGNNKVQWVTTRTDATITRRRRQELPSSINANNSSSSIDYQLVFTICEGKNRQIRRMCETIGLTVVKLHRVEFAGITLDRCPRPGSWAFLTAAEVDLLFQD
jgi:23S rRNA pseudouridine2604 synthase